MRSIFEISQRFSAMTAIEYIEQNGKVARLTYKSYAEKAYQAGSAISEKLAHIQKGSIVGLKIANSPSWGVIFWGMLMSGYQPLLIDARAEAESANALLAEADAKAIVCEDAYACIVPKVTPAELFHHRHARSFTPTWENHVLFCSSGTTGRPKVMVFTGQCLSYQVASARSMPDRTCDIMYPPELGNLKILAMLPFHHIFGFVAVFLWYTFFGKTLVYLENLRPETILRTCRVLNVSHVYGVPLLWNNLAQTLLRKASLSGKTRADIFRRLIGYHTHALTKKEAGYGASRSLLKKIQLNLMGRSIVYCISGGGYLSEETLRVINGIGYPLYNGYGLTEVGVTSVELDPDVKNRLKGSIGRPLYLMEYRIEPTSSADPNTGELFIKSNTTHIGTMQGGVFVPREGGEWFATGDIVSRDAQGNYYCKGRIKETIINADGENVFPDEIESSFAGLPLVEQLCVLGMAQHAGDRERITLVVKLAAEAGPDERAALSDEIRRINGTLPIHKQVQDVYISADPLPVVNTIKIQRTGIRDRLSAHPEAFARLNLLDGKDFKDYPKEYIEQLMADVRSVFAGVLSLSEASVGDFGHFVYDLGGDSLMYASLILEIEKRFHVAIPVQEYARCFSVNDFTLLVAQMQHPQGI